MSVTDHLPELVQRFLDDARLFVALSKETNADTHTQTTEVKDFKTGNVYDVVLTVTKRVVPSPRPDGWEERFKKQFDNQGPWGYPFSQTGLYDGIVFFIRQLLLSTRQEDARKFKEIIKGMLKEDKRQLIHMSSPAWNVLQGRIEAFIDVLTALSTWESTI